MSLLSHLNTNERLITVIRGMETVSDTVFETGFGSVDCGVGSTTTNR